MEEMSSEHGIIDIFTKKVSIQLRFFKLLIKVTQYLWGLHITFFILMSMKRKSVKQIL